MSPAVRQGDIRTASVSDFVRLVRPVQWVKNGFVLTGLLFSHAWNSTAAVKAAVLAMLGFCLVSSAVYVINDVFDRERDAFHPSKRHRPIAAGLVRVNVAMGLALLLAAAGLVVGFLASQTVAALLVCYAVLNSLYSASLKHVPVLDVFVIAAGFMLRILAGTTGIGIPPSQWLITCGMMVALFLGFSKRRAEVSSASDPDHPQRQVLQRYDAVLLDQFISIAGAGVILTYALYTMSPDTMALHRTGSLIYTVPFVIYGVLRILYRLHVFGRGEDPALDIVRDPHLVITFLAWLGVTLYLIA